MIAPTSFFADYGCHVRILEEARALQKLGHRVTIVTYHSGRAIDGVEIQRTIPIPWWRDAVVGSSPQKLAFDVLLSLKAMSVALHRRPDIIHGHLHEGALIGWPVSLLRRAPLIFDFQGSLTSEMVDHQFLRPDGPFFKPMRRLEEIINRLPSAIVTSTQHAADLCVREFGCPVERLHPVPDGVNLDVFRPGLLTPEERARRRAALGIAPNARVIAYLGLLAEYQGTSLLLWAAARLLRERDDVHFLIMGYPGQDRYRQMAHELGIADRVTLTGKIPYEQAPQALALGDIAVAPKVSATEGSGKLLNYMAMAMPTAAFDTPVSREYLADAGVYAPAGDPEGLAQALMRLLDHPAWAAELGRQLRRRAEEHYSWDRAGRQIVEIYEQVLSQHSKSRSREAVGSSHRKTRAS